MTTPFLQSPEWEAFQHSLGRKTWRVDGLLLIHHDMPFGFNYVYLPLVSGAYITQSFLEKVAAIAEAEKSIFLKVEPKTEIKMAFQHVLGKNLQPRKTLILNLTKPEDTLLAAMHQKTRYNIRLAAKHGVTVKKEIGARAARASF